MEGIYRGPLKPCRTGGPSSCRLACPEDAGAEARDSRTHHRICVVSSQTPSCPDRQYRPGDRYNPDPHRHRSLGVATTTLVFVSITLIGIVRSLISYSSVFMSILDGALCFLGLGVAAWAYGATGSAFWAIWCFFLSQSLFALIPEQPGRSNKPAGSTPLMETGAFSAAHKAAEAALRELAKSGLGR